VESYFRFTEQEHLEHTTFSVSDNPDLRLVVFLATAASNSIAKMKKVVAAFRKGALSTSSGARLKERMLRASR
jgi:hypothetical protein